MFEIFAGVFCDPLVLVLFFTIFFVAVFVPVEYPDE